MKDNVQERVRSGRIGPEVNIEEDSA